MNVEVFIMVIILLYCFFYFILRHFYKEMSVSKTKKRSFLLISCCYIVFMSLFTIFFANLFLSKFYNKDYDIKGKQSKINESNDRIISLKDRINNLTNIINLYDEDSINNEIYELEDSISKHQIEKDKIESVLDKKKNEYNNLLSEYKNLLTKTEFQIANFPIINQFPKYPNGCEIASLYLMLKYHGVDVSLEDLANKLEKGPAPYSENNITYGADPEKAFVGDPRLTNGKGYGVYQKPIIKLANQYKSGIRDITGKNLTDVLKIVKDGNPVQVWASINLKNPRICKSWIDKESQKKIDWLCGLHSLVLIGYDYNNVITADPYYGKIKKYSKWQFEMIYNIYGKRAIYYE